MRKQIIAGKRRFSCLSSGLVRMEFSPSGKFEDRHSVICYEKQKPVAFKNITEKRGKLYLDTGKMTVV